MKTRRRSIWAAAFAAALFMNAAARAQWAEIGPRPITDTIVTTGTPNAALSGMVDDIAIDPTGSTDRVIYAATSNGGVWKTTDGGQTWTVMTETMPSLAMGAVALDPSNASIVYAGTYGIGLYKSTNGGGSWSVLNPKNVFPPNQSIIRIVLPASNVLLVATPVGLFRSVDGGQNFGSNAPSYNNGLAIPIAAPGGSVANGWISDLKLDTANPSTVYAALRGTGIFKSTDSGATFPASGTLFSAASLPAGISTIAGIAFAQSTRPDNKTMYLTAAVLPPGTAFGTPCGPLLGNPTNPPLVAMFKSTDGGKSWPRQIPLGPEITPSLQADYDQIVGVDPWDSSRVYMGLRALYLSKDGGATGLRDYNQANGFACADPGNQDNRTDLNKAHSDLHVIAFSPASHFGGPAPTPIFTGNDGGIATTSNQGQSWSLPDTQLATVMFYSADMGRGSAANNAYTYGASQDNGISLMSPSQSGTNWSLVNGGGDGNGVAVDPLNPNHAIGIIDGNFTSTTNATNWSAVSPFPGQAAGTGISIVAFDPNGGTAYGVANNQLFQSTGTASVSSFSLIHQFSVAITAVGQVKGDPNTLWLGFNDGTVQRSSNILQGVNASWSGPIVVTGAPGKQNVSGIAIDPTNNASVVVVYPGFSGPSFDPPLHAFLTTNSGGSWSNIGGTPGGGANNLPDLPLFSIVTIPNGTLPGAGQGPSASTIVVGSSAGVMQSADSGRTWQVLGNNFPAVQVTSLMLDSSANPPLLRASTYGRSVLEFRSPPVAPTGCVGGSLAGLYEFAECYAYTSSGQVAFDQTDAMELERLDPTGWTVVDNGMNSWNPPIPRRTMPYFQDATFASNPSPPPTATYRVVTVNKWGQSPSASFAIKILTKPPASPNSTLLPPCGPGSEPYRPCRPVEAPTLPH